MFPANAVGVISNTILGLSEEQARAISENGWENLNDFHGYSTEDITTWTTTTARRQTQGPNLCVAPRAGVIFHQ